MDKRQPYRQPVKEARPSKLKQLGVIMLSFALGYLSSAVYDFSKLKNFLENSLLEHFSKQTKLVKIEKKAEILPKPKFEFYTILTKGEDDVAHFALQEQDIQPISSSNKILVSKIPTFKTLWTDPDKNHSHDSRYLLQVAAFPRLEDARKVQAELVAKHFKANIVEVTIKNILWYRIILGPFKAKEDVETARQAIAGYGNNTIVRKVAL